MFTLKCDSEILLQLTFKANNSKCFQFLILFMKFCWNLPVWHYNDTFHRCSFLYLNTPMYYFACYKIKINNQTLESLSFLVSPSDKRQKCYPDTLSSIDEACKNKWSKYTVSLDKHQLGTEVTSFFVSLKF